jgi:hypothetical protein
MAAICFLKLKHSPMANGVRPAKLKLCATFATGRFYPAAGRF